MIECVSALVQLHALPGPDGNVHFVVKHENGQEQTFTTTIRQARVFAGETELAADDAEIERAVAAFDRAMADLEFEDEEPTK